jgi:hypothetical protein
MGVAKVVLGAVDFVPALRIRVEESLLTSLELFDRGRGGGAVTRDVVAGQ